MPPGPASALGGGEGGGAGRGGGGARGRGKSGAPRRGSGRGTRRQQSASKPGSVRKTCDFCNYRKKRCDHGRPCGYCVRKNNGNCVYSLRKQQSRRSGPQLPPGHPGPDHLNSDEEDPGESAGVLVPVPTPPDPPEDEGDNPGAPRPKLPSHSQVFRAVERATGRRVAVKAVQTDSGGWLDRRDRRRLEFLRAEISVHREVSKHPFVVDLLGVFEDPEACFIVEELAEGGSLLDHLHSRASMGTEGEVRLLLRGLLAALLFLHSRRIVHRDIKPENILVMEEGVMHSAKLGDFGFAIRLDHNRHALAPSTTTTAVGTPEYVAPEVLLQQPFDGRADVWSAGVTAFCLLSGAMPFRGLTLDKLYTAVLDGACSYSGREWRGVSSGAQDFVRRMLVVDATERWTAERLLEHPWLTDGGRGPGLWVGDGVETETKASAAWMARRRARIRFKALALAVMFFNRLKAARVVRATSFVGAWSRQQELELGSP